MTRDEIALKLIVTELERADTVLRLTNPRPLWWTTPAIYTVVDNALWMADALLMPKKDRDDVSKTSQDEGQK